MPRRRPPLAPTEIVAVGMLAWNAVALALPADTFGRSITWRAMAQVAPEPVWAAVIGAVAVVLAVGTRLPLAARLRTHLLAIALLMFMAGMFAYANWRAVAVGNYAAAAMGLAWLRVRLHLEDGELVQPDATEGGNGA